MHSWRVFSGGRWHKIDADDVSIALSGALRFVDDHEVIIAAFAADHWSRLEQL